mmetsp:Transcript_4380/g.14000  ORF Transcript_4380/g.14000 Transcript_4380/m.14000 type:complete len:225 (+) Transcript_4380:416-1090(+)
MRVPCISCCPRKRSVAADERAFAQQGFGARPLVGECAQAAARERAKLCDEGGAPLVPSSDGVEVLARAVDGGVDGALAHRGVVVKEADPRLQGPERVRVRLEIVHAVLDDRVPSAERELQRRDGGGPHVTWETVGVSLDALGSHVDGGPDLVVALPFALGEQRDAPEVGDLGGKDGLGGARVCRRQQDVLRLQVAVDRSQAVVQRLQPVHDAADDALGGAQALV